MTPKNSPQSAAIFFTAALICSSSLPALGEPKSSDNAQAFVQEVKKRDLEREIAAKQTEVNRLKEDLTKERTESENLKRSIEGLGVAVDETMSNLERLSAERARLSQALEVATLRVDAEKLKVTGLKMLSDGQNKVLSYISGRIEAMERKAEIASVELKLINFQNPLPAEELILDNSTPAANSSGAETTTKLKAQLAELRKKGSKSQQLLQDASNAADAAIEAASAKVALADAAAAKANKRADELGLSEVAAGPIETDAISAPKATPVR